jgi:hypothetical protein
LYHCFPSIVENVASVLQGRLEIRWLGDRHPQLNHEAWSQAELANLRTLVAEYGERQVDWVQVASKLGVLFARSVSDHATAQQCQSRFMRTLDSSLTRGAWSPAEDAQLQAAVEAYGPHAWVDVAALVPGRNNEQCRDRWQDKLNPTLVKGKWTEQEDQALVSAVERLGTAWKVRVGTGRTNRMVKSGLELVPLNH